MESLSEDELTFDDNSTLTSFTGLKGHQYNNAQERYIDEDNSYEDKENSKRDGIISNLKASFSGSRTRLSHHSNRNGNSHDGSSSSQSSAQFWAALSAHAASVAITSSLDRNHPNGMAVAAADAAAESLSEDRRAMEAFENARHPGGTITHQTVQNAATKASIAVLKSGVDYGVAAEVASAIIREGGRMLSENAKSQISFKQTMSTSSSLSTILTSPSKAYHNHKNSMTRKKKTSKNLQQLQPSSPPLYSTQNFYSSLTSQPMISNSPAAFCVGNAGNAEGMIYLKSFPERSILLNSPSDSLPFVNARHANLLTEFPRGHPPVVQRHNGASTVESISSVLSEDKYDVSNMNSIVSVCTSKYNDKYATFQADSPMNGSKSKAARGARHSPTTYAGLKNGANIPMTKEVLDAVRAAVKIVKLEDRNNPQMAESNSASSRTDTSSGRIRINEEMMNVVREAMAVADPTLDETPFAPSSARSAKSTSTERRPPEFSFATRDSSPSVSAREEAVSDEDPGPPLPSRLHRENASEGMELLERIESASAQSEPSDASTIETERYHELQQPDPIASGERARADSTLSRESSAEIESISGNVYSSSGAENQRAIDRRKSHRPEEEEESERNQINCLQAIEVQLVEKSLQPKKGREVAPRLRSRRRGWPRFPSRAWRGWLSRRT